MLGAVLRNLDACITRIDNGLLYPKDLVTKHKGNALRGLRGGGRIGGVGEESGYFGLGGLEGDGIVCLLDGIDPIAPAMQVGNGSKRVLKILPINRFFCPQSGLVNLLIGRTTADAAQIDPLDKKGIGGTKNSPDIVLAADIVQHCHQRQFLGLVEGLRSEAVHLLYA